MTKKKPESQVSVDFQQQRELFSPTFVSADPDSLCFPEWFDSEVNAEKWDTDSKEPQLYVDSQTVILPPSIIGYELKRPFELFPDAEMTIYVDKPVYPDLVAGSQHLLDSEFVRSFVSSVETLCYLGNARKFSMEYTSPYYVPNTADKPWRPWHHVYSRCRAGKGEKHQPAANKIGKYIVRIFWMGCWRKIYVDDLLPLDSSRQILLPSLPLPKVRTPPPTRPGSSKTFSREKTTSSKSTTRTGKESADTKKTRIRDAYVLEMWPFLLAKALMKVASMTWSENAELNGFDIIQCLTGWIPYKMYTGVQYIPGLGLTELWDYCKKHTSKFVRPEDRPVETKTKKTRSTPRITEDNADAFENNCYLTLCYSSSRPDYGGRKSHSFLVDQTRDIPLVKPSKLSDFPAWKHYRWVDWAVERGMIPPLENDIPIRSLKTVDPFRSIHDETVYDNFDLVMNNDERPASSINRDSSPSEKSTENKKSKGKKRPKSKEKIKDALDLVPDITRWIDLEPISEHIKHLTVYYKPSKFQVKVRISNIACENIQKEIKPHPARTLEQTLLPNWKEIIRPETLLPYRNEPLNFFRDSLTSQTIVINFSQTGHQQVLEKMEEDATTVGVTESNSECGICSSTLLRRVITNINKGEEEAEEPVNIVKVPLYSEHHHPLAHLVVSKCNWADEHVDNTVDSLETFGSDSIVMVLKPGRQLYSLWIKSETSYVTQIISDCALCVATLEEIYPLMAEESRSLEKIAKAVTKSFEAMIKSFGKADFQDKIREYYNSYKPFHKLDKYELKTIHETFYDEFQKLVILNLGDQELAALKILFRKVQLPPSEQMSDLTTFCYPVHLEEMKYVKIMEEAATKIQSFFKGCYERALLKRHKTTNKHHKSIAESLHKINSTLFSGKGGLNLGTTLLRNFLNNDNIYDFREKYQCYEDNQNTITLHQFPNIVKNARKGWNILCRQIFFMTSYSPLVIRIKMFCNINDYMVRVFDNDTGQEFRIFTNNVIVSEYPHNYNGYTVLCYGLVTSDALLFKLVFAVSKESEIETLSFPNVVMKSEIKRENYIPSVKGLLCKYQILVKSEYVLLTIHFIPDFPGAKLLLRLYHQQENLIQEVYGQGSALIPAVMLENQLDVPFKRMTYTESIKSMDKKMSKPKLSKGIHDMSPFDNNFLINNFKINNM